MRITAKFILVLIISTAAVLGVSAWLRVQREVRLFEADMRRDAAMVGEALARAVEHAWLFEGELTPQIAGEIGIDPQTGGVAIAGVDPNSPAADAGLRPGDVVLEIDGRPVSRASAAVKALRAASDRPHVLLVLREGKSFYVPLQPRGE